MSRRTRKRRIERERIERIEHELNANRKEHKVLNGHMWTVVNILHEKIVSANDKIKFQERKIATLNERVGTLMADKRELQAGLTRLAWDVSVLGNQVAKQQVKGKLQKLKEMFGAKMRA